MAASEITELFATAATADQNGAGVGVIWWATHPPGDYALSVLDYDISEVPAVNADWIGAILERSKQIDALHAPAQRGCHIRVEHAGLAEIFKRADAAYRDTPAPSAIDRSIFSILPIKPHEAAKWAPTLDERAFSIRPLVDSGKIVKIEKGLRRLSFRAIKTNHLISQIRRHRPGDAASAGELLHAFVLGVLLGTTPRSMSFFEAHARRDQTKDQNNTASKGPFGAYIPGRRPW